MTNNHPNRSKAARQIRDAAPALLAALEQMVSAAEVDGHDTEAEHCASCVATRIARAAIAQATQPQPKRKATAQ